MPDCRIVGKVSSGLVVFYYYYWYLVTLMKTKIALYISIVGHPLVTLCVFTVVALFTYEAFGMALLHSSLILLGIFLPLTLRMYLKARKGSYSNFDVSDKAQRQSWYIFACLLLLMVTLVLFVTGQPRTLSLSLLFSLILLATSQLLNYFIKSSLHVSLNIFLGFLILPMSVITAVFFFAFTVFIGWSRFTLKRHTLKEIMAGVVLGVTVGLLMYLVIFD